MSKVKERLPLGVIKHKKYVGKDKKPLTHQIDLRLAAKLDNTFVIEQSTFGGKQLQVNIKIISNGVIKTIFIVQHKVDDKPVEKYCGVSLTRAIQVYNQI